MRHKHMQLLTNFLKFPNMQTHICLKLLRTILNFERNKVNALLDFQSLTFKITRIFTFNYVQKYEIN